MKQWILYGIIGVVNLIIIGAIFFLYRKFIKPKKDEAEVDTNTEEPKPNEEVNELPMDEMVIDELDDLEEDIDLAEKDSVEQAVSADSGLADLTPESLDDNIEEDILSEEVVSETGIDSSEENEDAPDNFDIGLDDEEKSELVPDAPTQDTDNKLVDDTGEISNDFKTELLDDEQDSDDDALNDMLNLEDDESVPEASADTSTDEEPEFDLDDFAPDQLDAEDSEKKE